MDAKIDRVKKTPSNKKRKRELDSERANKELNIGQKITRRGIQFVWDHRSLAMMAYFLKHPIKSIMFAIHGSQEARALFDYLYPRNFIIRGEEWVRATYEAATELARSGLKKAQAFAKEVLLKANKFVKDAISRATLGFKKTATATLKAMKSAPKMANDAFGRQVQYAASNGHLGEGLKKISVQGMPPMEDIEAISKKAILEDAKKFRGQSVEQLQKTLSDQKSSRPKLQSAKTRTNVDVETFKSENRAYLADKAQLEGRIKGKGEANVVEEGKLEWELLQKERAEARAKAESEASIKRQKAHADVEVAKSKLEKAAATEARGKLQANPTAEEIGKFKAETKVEVEVEIGGRATRIIRGTGRAAKFVGQGTGRAAKVMHDWVTGETVTDTARRAGPGGGAARGAVKGLGKGQKVLQRVGENLDPLHEEGYMGGKMKNLVRYKAAEEAASASEILASKLAKRKKALRVMWRGLLGLRIVKKGGGFGKVAGPAAAVIMSGYSHKQRQDRLNGLERYLIDSITKGVTVTLDDGTEEFQEPIMPGLTEEDLAPLIADLDDQVDHLYTVRPADVKMAAEFGFMMIPGVFPTYVGAAALAGVGKATGTYGYLGKPFDLMNAASGMVGGMAEHTVTALAPDEITVGGETVYSGCSESHSAGSIAATAATEFDTATGATTSKIAGHKKSCMEQRADEMFAVWDHFLTEMHKKNGTAELDDYDESHQNMNAEIHDRHTKKEPVDMNDVRNRHVTTNETWKKWYDEHGKRFEHLSFDIEEDEEEEEEVEVPEPDLEPDESSQTVLRSNATCGGTGGPHFNDKVFAPRSIIDAVHKGATNRESACVKLTT